MLFRLTAAASLSKKAQRLMTIAVFTPPFDGVQRRRGGRPIDPLHEIPIVSERRQQLVTIKRPMQRKGDDVQRL